MIRMRFCLLLLLFLLAVFTTSGKDGRSYKFYYKAINEAELSVVELNFAQAYDIYNLTFKEFEKHQRSDLYNAVLCAILTSNNTQAKLWIKELITLGFSLKNFEAYTFKLFPANEWDEIKTQYDSLHNIYRSNLDLTYLAALDSLRSREQRLVMGSQIRYDSLLYVHTKLLHRMITERGIPRGFEYGGQPLPIDILRHHFGLRNRLKYNIQNGVDTSVEPYHNMNFRVYDLEILLKDAVFKGNLTPNFVAACIDHSELDGTMRQGVFEVCADLNTKTITFFEPKQIDLETIDAHRMSLGLEKCRDAAKKDIELALLYEQKKFPFDEFIRRSKEIGYTKEAVSALNNNRKEQDKITIAFLDLIKDIRKTVLDKDNLKVENFRDDNPIYLNKWELLKQFRLEKSIVVKHIEPLKR